MFDFSPRYFIRTHILSLTLLLLIHNVISGWVDPDTQTKFYTTTPLAKNDDREYKLVSLYYLMFIINSMNESIMYCI